MVPHPSSLEMVIFDRRFIRRVAWGLAAIVAALVVAEVLFVILWTTSPYFIQYQVDVDNEANWSTWFKVNLNQFAAIAAFLIAWLSNRQPAAPGKRRNVIGWALIGSVFAYVAMDDAATIHEHAVGFFTRLVQILGLTSSFASRYKFYLWIPILGAVGMVVLFFMLRFFRESIWQVPRARLLVILGLALFLAKLPTELVESAITAPRGDQTVPQMAEALFQEDHTAWVELKLMTLVQETTTMLGAICFLTGFLTFGNNLLWPAAPVAAASAAGGGGEPRKHPS